MTVKELIELLMDFPEDESVYVPDFDTDKDAPVTNAVLGSKGVLLDY